MIQEGFWMITINQIQKLTELVDRKTLYSSLEKSGLELILKSIHRKWWLSDQRIYSRPKFAQKVG